MKNDDRPKLYIKPRCPWCLDALSFFARHGVALDIRDVTTNRHDMARMVAISGQSLTPTFEFGEFVVADFSVNEFLSELEQVPEIKHQLGFGNEEDL